MDQIKIKVVDNLTCPVCGATEVEDMDAPIKDWVFNIRAFKVHDGKRWRSQCMKCVEAAGGDRNKGWF